MYKVTAKHVSNGEEMNLTVDGTYSIEAKTIREVYSALNTISNTIQADGYKVNRPNYAKLNKREISQWDTRLAFVSGHNIPMGSAGIFVQEIS